MVLLGGITGSAYNDRTIVFRPGSNGSSDIGSGDSPGGRVDHCAVGSGKLVYVYGGRTVTGLQRDLWVLDAETGAWQILGEASLYLSPCSIVVASHSKLMILGSDPAS